MLDYYSSDPGPTKEAAIQELIKVVGNETKVREIMEKEEKENQKKKRLNSNTKQLDICKNV